MWCCRQAYIDADDGEQSSALSLETMELQWKDYVTQLKNSGTLSSALAMTDVSGSMHGEPMQVSLTCCQSSESLLSCALVLTCTCRRGHLL